mgnify:FL=1
MSVTLVPEQKQYFKDHLPGISERSVLSVLSMAEDGATVPFMARYRKERTGNLDEVQIRDVLKANETFQELVKRKEFILAEIDKQGNLTDELAKQIKASDRLAELEEIYRPYKRKKKTKRVRS